MKTGQQSLSISAALLQATAAFKKQSESARLDAGVLLAHLLNKPRSWLTTHMEELLTEDECTRLDQALKQVGEGLPLPYILGHWEFHGLEFAVDRHVLIPRPETELLVDTALQWLCSHPEQRRLADIGTGSGCIAISLAVEVLDLQVEAIELSESALMIAQLNVKRHRVSERVRLYCGDLTRPLTGAVDIVCANLPYIPTNMLKTLPVSNHEPSLALNGGVDGLKVIRRLLELSPACVNPGGLILLEIEASLGMQVIDLARLVYPSAVIDCRQDFAGLDRLVSIVIPEA
ncbi:MAG: peptide chain release factor N(5)-glutamine methyltransferase [Anaerolineaceae bacterium]|nr:peptide chain release factor N(5)-glutamine methyltransferase [Anaerolineaceae bacterium]MBN2676814.1 peptide chain release factor N(5)-glutamine methyltransferase [Anaerolineaceae bacterium]